MQRRIPGAVGVLAALALLASCTGADQSSGLPPAFERVEIAGLTDQHASTGGVSWVDHDADGDLDLLVTNGYDVSAGTPVAQRNRVFRQTAPGVFAEVAAGALAASEGIGSGHTWGDYDNDGDLDVFVANQQDQDNQLFRNEGGGVFVAVDDVPPVQDGGDSYAAAWVDVDGDGWLDLFVANGGMSHAGPNALYRGLGQGRFERVTEGSIVTDEAATCGIAWGDYDDDGDPDLFVANQGFASPTNHDALYRNDGEWVFTRLTEGPAVNDGLPSCAATWVDLDNDGDLDLHVTSMYGLADRLYLNDGLGGLSPAPDSPPTVDGGHSYGAVWEDLDNDGDLDAVVANWGAAAAVYLNDGRGGFTRATAGDLGARIDHAGAVAAADVDADGDIDIYVGNWPNHPGPGELNSFYRNRGGAGHWLRLRLVGSAGNRAAIGARILATAAIAGETVTQRRDVTAQTGFRGQSDLAPHLGLGDARTVDRVEIHWPSGRTSLLEGVAADQVVTVTEPGR